MLTGFATGCPTDNHDEMLLGFIPTYDSTHPQIVYLPIRPAVGCGNQFWVFGADENIQKIIYILEGSSQLIQVLLDPLRTYHSVFAEPNGTWNTAGSINFFGPTMELTALNGATVYGTFTAESEFSLHRGLSTFYSNINITGLTRYVNTRPSGLNSTEAECDLISLTSGFNRPTTIELNGSVLASATGTGLLTGPGTLTFVEQNNSGVSGTIDVNFAVPLTDASLLVKRYAASYDIESTAFLPWLSFDSGLPISSFDTNHQIYVKD